MVQKTLSDIKGLIAVSQDEESPHLVIEGADIFDVMSCTVYRGNIWTYREWIAYTGEHMPRQLKDTIVIDGNGLVAVPGYIDAHGHSDLFYNPSTFADYAVTRGATTVYSDAHDMVNSIGYDGFIKVVQASDDFALKYLWGVPATYPPYPEVEGREILSFENVIQLFSAYKECVAISELSSYMRILKKEDDILEKILMARSMGKNVEGHTLGASYQRLNGLVAAGITSCHESITGLDLKNRVRLGFYTMVRHSSIRSDFEELCPFIKTLPKDTIMLVSDGVFARDLITKGYMDYIIHEAVTYGITPEDAIRMVTLNPARYFRLESDIGSITPGRIADILLLEDMHHFTPIKVIERGRVVAENGMLCISTAPFPDVKTMYHPYVFKRVEKDEFTIPWDGRETIPVIEIVDRTVTQRVDINVKRDNGVLVPEKDKDIRKILYTRRDTKKWGKGFVRGIGADIGGMALTISHETHGLLVVGFDDQDMEIAANRVLTIGGGIVLVDKGKILHTFFLPHGATMSDLNITELADALHEVNTLIKARGSKLDDPVWTLGFLTFTSIVTLRITPSGIYDVRKREIVF